MSSSVKKHVISKVFETALRSCKLANIDQIASCVTIHYEPKKNPQMQIKMPLFFEHENEKELESVQMTLPLLLTDNIILSTEFCERGNMLVTVDKKTLARDILSSDPLKLNFVPTPGKIIVEFSSPNVAKPFHAGHLRSTIIGNFIANIKEKVGKEVTRINYLGDWGTQFGLLKYGVEQSKVSKEKLMSAPMKTLYEAYVWANKEAERDSSVYDKAREHFRKLEEGDDAAIQTWKKYRNLSQIELERTYKRLGVRFDAYHWESMYGRKEVNAALSKLNDHGLLTTDTSGRLAAKVRGRAVPLIKSDGSTLYLMRDVAAALHRQQLTNSNESLYVVENGQADHFISLFSICREFGLDKSWNMKHVKFGRIHGMSTRKGSAVFLEDILNQTRDIVLKKLKETKTTKVPATPELADILGCSAVIVNDLKQRRIRDYDFSWDKALQVSGDTAIRLQYAHARLYSLLLNSGHTPATHCDIEALSEPEAEALIFDIGRYEEAILKAHSELEPCVVVSYLFHLTHTINKALKVLPVKDSGVNLASQRLLLFNIAKKVLEDGLKLLGIVPLNQM